ncbi:MULTISPECIES: hypothetical protein [Leptospira]|uniref:Uncharacterized protein n=1 Tax=Leptospira kirschneri serovar Pomona TaxID=561005 RepID=A0A1T1DMJ6_9LEPT|nr:MULTISPECIES: hypothetical protein [Leptospira]EMK05562.1 hypothetical protein LEP1GSC166_4067 [Leptospira kirschneri]EMN26601.1 hypothetical protein LEP1GSC065_2591 [Leptospira kirschneri serovar Sokoine str. RM1]EMO65677.1 hypothetical protein LEP1GSC132_0193 [Leptospira kirschneri str. 200803703]KXZ24353.1 hypothetical protein AYB32_04890 [Leptospira kirschneri]KXZ27688.1 hypothetical protein AYB34_03765 [Leptospira sp. ZV016]
MKRIIKLLYLVLMLFLFNCSHNWGQFKRYSVEAPVGLEVVGSTVSGRSCSFGPTRWYASSIAEATRDALAQAPGATGLKDVEVIAQSYQYFFLGCIKVEGTPVREVVAATKPSPKKD